MFDTNKVAGNIKSARTRKNMTQMNLADEMGVSYQAVSNWERGSSMPDISKLPELCRVLDISFEELVGEEGSATDITKRLMQDEGAEVSLEEMAKVGQLVNPDTIETKVNETIERGRDISFSTLVGLAPFLDKDTLGKMAEGLAAVDLGKLCAIAPFLSKETMDRIVEKSIRNGRIPGNITAIAPFLSKATLQKIAEYYIEHGQSGKLVTIAPFMEKDMLKSQLQDMTISMDERSNYGEAVNSMLDDLDEEDAAKLAFDALEKGEDTVEYLDYMDEDDVARLANRALELDREIMEYLDYMDEDDVAKLANRALELDKETVEYLDYMDADDVARLASKALVRGKEIESYLDYMDEDAIKRLLLQAAKR